LSATAAVTPTAPAHRPPHPVVYTILYFPFGALGGFIGVALTFLGTRHGLSISESAFLNGASMMMNWLKWIWAPLVDTTLTPKRWYYHLHRRLVGRRRGHRQHPARPADPAAPASA
jgi:hypothetical protein